MAEDPGERYHFLSHTGFRSGISAGTSQNGRFVLSVKVGSQNSLLMCLGHSPRNQMINFIHKPNGEEKSDKKIINQRDAAAAAANHGLNLIFYSNIKFPMQI